MLKVKKYLITAFQFFSSSCRWCDFSELLLFLQVITDDYAQQQYVQYVLICLVYYLIDDEQSNTQCYTIAVVLGNLQR